MEDRLLQNQILTFDYAKHVVWVLSNPRPFIPDRINGILYTYTTYSRYSTTIFGRKNIQVG